MRTRYYSEKMKKKSKEELKQGFQPSEFMRARRPHLFSDTEWRESLGLDRSTFEYHLETLTARKQELDFEHFARKLIEKEICPNLLPQTGPTGGGDSKVDSETYPVSQEIAERWYHADAAGRDGTTERWAFAFSAKEQWKSKARSDIKHIAETGRGYKVGYFVTNQFVKDKDRAAVEDELRKKYGLDVRILDRTWIADRVFTNKRQNLAIETLRLSVPFVPAAKKGPRDTARESELEELERQIADHDRYNGVAYQLIEDALQTALIARGLELPRADVDGRFERAIRLAHDHGTGQQQLRCAYNKAWSCFWWYDDFTAFNELYATVESLAGGSSQTSDIELLQNLWQLLHASVTNGNIPADKGRVPERTIFLRNEWKRLENEKGRPSAALYAQASQLVMDMSEGAGNPKKLKAALEEFRRIFEKSKGLVDFPVQLFVDVLMELGEFFRDDETFDSLFEAAVNAAQERKSRAVSGRMLLRRGTQKLEVDKPYQAIRLLGRAQQELAHYESRNEMVVALCLCGDAYKRAGLLWAARGSTLLAANQALRTFWEHGEVTGLPLACLRELIWVELQLGRIPCALAWIDTFLVLNGIASPDEERNKRLEEQWIHINALLGLLFLKTEIFDLKNLERVPAVLEQLQLDPAWMALLYALGYEDRLRSEKVIPEDESAESVLEFFDKWANLPTNGEVLYPPQFLETQTLELRSNVLGCEVVVAVPNNNRSLFIAEGVLGALEAFLATSLNAELLPYASRVQLKIVPADFLDVPLEFTVMEPPLSLIEIRHPTDASIDPAHAAGFQDKMIELICTIASHIAVIPDGPETFLTEVIKNELGFGRAMLLTNIETLTGNVLGKNPKLHLFDWDSSQNQSETFPLRRREVWNGEATSNKRDEVTSTAPAWGSGDPPSDLRDRERLRHWDQKVLSLINIGLWNKAGWNATGYITSNNPDEPPYLALVFKDMDAAARIFDGWKQEIGSEDREEKLRVSIITGISADNPAAYRVIVSINLRRADTEGMEGKHLVIVSRMNTMHPSTSANLDRFLESYAIKKEYTLVLGSPGPDVLAGWVPNTGILKRELVVRPAWQIAEHDPDISGIYADDKIIIPEGVTDAPVLKTLARKAERQQKAGFKTASDPAPKTDHKLGRNDPCFCGSGKKYKKCHGK